VSQKAEDYVARAGECVRLANLSGDDMIRRELLLLRQTYLRVAEALGIPMAQAIAAASPSVRKPN
jgi:hypothetical protein